MRPLSAAAFRPPVLRGLALSILLALAGGCARRAPEHWDLTDIRGYLPDLKFNLDSSPNPRLTATDFRGKVVLLYFGYLHCPDVCPMTMSKLSGVVRELGPGAEGVRILFVSVDPERDTPEMLRSYAKAFSPEAVGATSTPDGIEALARRYRVAYVAQTPDRYGNYVVMHSKAVYIFDRKGRARFLISDTDTSAAIEHDLRQLLAAS